ncbi:MAG: hypothetical protein JWN48_6096 [Myxococcaceae bacterium]|nr:hypothetical protein [Myxococcaceae bacterium]
MKREKRTTKKERKAAAGGVVARPAARGAAPAQRAHDHTHIHCVACGKHLDPSSFGEPGGPAFYRCQHGSDFAHCAEHEVLAKQLVDEHDRTGKPVKSVAAWH